MKTLLARDRLLAFATGVAFLEAAFFSVLAPLLAPIVDQLELSDRASGLLVAGHPVGMIVATIPAAVLASRYGCRPTALVGLGLLVVSCLAFALADDAGTLIAARVAQGMGSATAWAGGFAWLIARSDPARRGAAVGLFIAAAFAGSLTGPAIGVVADAFGRLAVFGALAGFAAIVALAAPREEAPDAAGRIRARDLFAAHASPVAGTGFALLVGMGIGTGSLALVGPLLIEDRGGAPALTGAIFFVASAVQLVLSPLVGRVADRRGARVPAMIAAGVGAVGMAVLPLIGGLALMTVVLTVALSAVVALWAPGSLLVQAGTAARTDHAGAGVAGMNASWALGAAIGAAVLPNIGLASLSPATSAVNAALLVGLFVALVVLGRDAG
jgi:predicted MFS family arabinose efflux permease